MLANHIDGCPLILDVCNGYGYPPPWGQRKIRNAQRWYQPWCSICPSFEGGGRSTTLNMASAFWYVLLFSSCTYTETGFISSRRVAPLYITSGVVTCGFSLVIGAYFALGQGQQLPDLKRIFGAA